MKKTSYIIFVITVLSLLTYYILSNTVPFNVRIISLITTLVILSLSTIILLVIYSKSRNKVSLALTSVALISLVLFIVDFIYGYNFELFSPRAVYYFDFFCFIIPLTFFLSIIFIKKQKTIK